jgi:hypothetical protein
MMTADDKRDWMHLQGRIIVLELMMRSLLTAKMLQIRSVRSLDKVQTATTSQLASARPGAGVVSLTFASVAGRLVRGIEFNCSRAPCGRQGTNRSVPSFGAFENLARDVPARLMCFSAAWQELTCPFEREFHIGSHSRSKPVRKHDNPAVSDR